MVVTPSMHDLAASYCDVTMTYGFLWTHGIEVGELRRLAMPRVETRGSENEEESKQRC